MTVWDKITELQRRLEYAEADMAFERAALRRAETRVAAAVAVVGIRRAELIATFPAGVGSKIATRAPWETLRFTETEVNGEWWVLPGAHIADALRELPELARICGESITVEMNGTHAIAYPGESHETIRQRYIDAGGIGA